MKLYTGTLDKSKIHHNEELYEIMIENTQMQITRPKDINILTYLGVNCMALSSYKICNLPA